MSYCRSNGDDSDVYVIGTRDYLECFGAGWELEQRLPVHAKVMAPDWTSVDVDGKTKMVQLDTHHVAHRSFYTKSRQGMIDHLKVHKAMGHKVPKRAIKRLRDEIAKEGDTY